MAFPLLGQPRPAYFDANGNPLDNGVLEFREPTSGLVKYTYITAADADIDGVKNPTDILLNERGEPDNDIWGRDGELYDVTLKDANGAVVWYIADVAWGRGTLLSTDFRIPRTSAEASAGIAEYSPLNTVGGIVRPDLMPGDARRYGADPTGTSDSHPALQAAINAATWARQDGSGHPATADFGTGTFLCNNDLYNYYDLSSNPNANGVGGRIQIKGDYMPDYAKLQSDTFEGCVIKFAAGKQWLVSDSVDNTTPYRGQYIHDVGVYTDINGISVKCHGTSHSSFKRINILNKNTGANAVGLSITDSWVTSFEDIFVVGANYREVPAGASPAGDRTNFSGTGIKHTAAFSGGGDTRFVNVNSNGWNIGWELGEDWNQDTNYSVSPQYFLHCQSHYNHIGFHIKCRYSSSTFKQCYAEYNFNHGSEAGAGFKVTDSGGMQKPQTTTNRSSTLIFDSCQIGTSDTLESYHMLFGTDASAGSQVPTDHYEAAHGNIIVRNPYFGQTNTGVTAIRRYNSKLNGYLKIFDPDWGFNGGAFLKLENEPQYNLVQLKGLEGLKWNGGEQYQRYLVTDEAEANNLSIWLGGESDISADLGAITTVDYSDCFDINRNIQCTPVASGTIEIKLPSRSAAGDYTVHITKGNAQPVDFELDATAPAWQASTFYIRNQMVKSSGQTYICRIEGVSHDTTPPSGTGSGLIPDEGVSWLYAGESGNNINNLAGDASANTWTSLATGLFRTAVVTVRQSEALNRAIHWTARELD